MTASASREQTDPEASPSEAQNKALTVRGATVLGIGSMIGAGIFALLGEAGTVAGAAVWISFLFGGIVAGLLGYVCAKLGMRFPSSGGLITYLIEGFGQGRLVGIACWLGYMAAIVIVGALVAVSFGSYATSLFVGEHASSTWNNVFITALLLAMLAVNLVGAKFVANAQSVIVAGVLGVFAVFIVVTIVNINPDLLAFSSYPSLSKILASVALTFFAYLGFNVITFTAGDLRDPAHDLPRAMTFALGITSLTYILIAVGVFGTLTTTQVIGYGETAIAEAARPTLGDAGFTIMAIVALLSTAGCTNATLYASGNLTGQLARTGLFPDIFGETSRLGRHAGLLITTGLVLIVANRLTPSRPRPRRSSRSSPSDSSRSSSTRSCKDTGARPSPRKGAHRLPRADNMEAWNMVAISQPMKRARSVSASESTGTARGSTSSSSAWVSGSSSSTVARIR